jgi:4-amino-4-deoxy-L-arabinose transferase-like glycosyltransferase
MLANIIHNKKKLVIIAIFLLIFLIRSPHINNSITESGDLWRQADTESIARNFIKYKFNIFYPQFNYDGPPPNYVQLEFQLTTFIIAILYKFFGYHIWLARLVPLCFFMASAYFVFLIARMFYRFEQALVAVVIYGVLPITLFFSRAIMPEAAMLCFLTGGYYHFLKWYETEKVSYLFISALLTCLAISQKVPAAFVGLAMLALCIEKYKFKAFLRWDLWAFAIISILPNLIYILWAGSIAESRFVSGIASGIIIPRFLTSFATSEAYNFYRYYIPRLFGWPIIAVTGLGLLSLYKREERPILYFALAMLLEVLMIVSSVRLRYYLIIITPVVAILSGKILGLLWNIKFLGKAVLTAFIIFLCYTSWQQVKPNYTELEWLKTARGIINTYTKPEDLIIIGTEDPALLSISDRTGWRGNVKHDRQIPRDIAGGMKYYIQHGAKYFVVYKDYISRDNGAYIRYLKQNYQSFDFGRGIVMYKLQTRLYQP